MSLNISRRTAAKAFMAPAAGSMWPGLAPQMFGANRQTVSEEKIRTEVCVIGGGSGGTGAALAAARAGAKDIFPRA